MTTSFRALLSKLSMPVLAATFVLLTSGAGFAETRIKDILGTELTDAGVANRPVVLMVALAALALVPFVLIMVTSFVKIAVVLSIVRQAIGTQQIPPTQVITGLASILTIYIMMPVGLEIYHNTESMLLKEGKQGREGALIGLTNLTVDQMLQV